MQGYVNIIQLTYVNINGGIPFKSTTSTVEKHPMLTHARMCEQNTTHI